MLSFLNRLINVPSTDPDEACRRRLLNILALGDGFLCLLGLAFALVSLLTGDAINNQATLAAIGGALTMLTGVTIILLINRYGSAVLASTLFLTLLTLVLIFAEAPNEVVSGRGLSAFAFPIWKRPSHTYRPPPQAQRHLEMARYVARDSLVEARRLARTLQPKQLEEAALPHIIERVAGRWSAANEIPVTTVVTALGEGTTLVVQFPI